MDIPGLHMVGPRCEGYIAVLYSNEGAVWVATAGVLGSRWAGRIAMML